MNSFGVDVTFEMDDFNRPKLLNSSEMMKNIAMFIMYSKKGQIPSLPSVGLNIEKYLYEDYENLDISELEQNIADQCSALNNFFARNGKIEKLYENDIPSLKISLNYNPSEQTKRPYQDYQLGLSYDELIKIVPEEE